MLLLILRMMLLLLLMVKLPLAVVLELMRMMRPVWRMLFSVLLLLMVHVAVVPLVGQQRVDVLVAGWPLWLLRGGGCHWGAQRGHAQLLVPVHMPRVGSAW